MQGFRQPREVARKWGPVQMQSDESALLTHQVSSMRKGARTLKIEAQKYSTQELIAAGG